MRTIGLTGGIASGKSTVSALLQSLGAHIIDADTIAREIVSEGSEALCEIVRAFGAGILTPEGALNRAALARIVFNDPQALSQLNAITHPRIIAEIETRLRALRSTEGIAVLDAALLIELGLFDLVDETWLICVEPSVQLARLLKREHMTPEDAEKIIRAQLPLSEKRKAADRCIDNNGSQEDLDRQIIALWNQQVKR